MTTASYASQFAGYSGQQFTVEPKATPRNADVIVHSRLVPANGDPVTFNYLMRGSGADWKIEDVYLDGTISQLAVRRSEFSAILASGGPGRAAVEAESPERRAAEELMGLRVPGPAERRRSTREDRSGIPSSRSDKN